MSRLLKIPSLPPMLAVAVAVAVADDDDDDDDKMAAELDCCTRSEQQ